MPRRRGSARCPAAALEQVETQLFFQATDLLLADGAMGRVQAFRRARRFCSSATARKAGRAFRIVAWLDKGIWIAGQLVVRLTDQIR